MEIHCAMDNYENTVEFHIIFWMNMGRETDGKWYECVLYAGHKLSFKNIQYFVCVLKIAKRSQASNPEYIWRDYETRKEEKCRVCEMKCEQVLVIQGKCLSSLVALKQIVK